MKGKRLVITLLVISLIVPLFSGFTAPVNEVIAAADVPVVNEADVIARVKELAKLLGINKGDLSEGSGVYFTVNGKQCDHAYDKDDNCSNCYNENVIKSDWFKKVFGYTVDVDLLPGHFYPNGGKGYPRGRTCHGFANFALWFVAKSDNKSDVYRDLLGTSKEKFSVSNLKKLDVRIGDIVRVSAGHSFMFLKYVNDSTILVLDCNSVKKNQVAIHTIDTSKKYVGSTMAVTRAQNYKPDNKHETKEVTTLKETPSDADVVFREIESGLWKYFIDLAGAVVDTFAPTDVTSFTEFILEYKESVKLLLDADIIGKVTNESTASALWEIYSNSVKTGDISEAVLEDLGEIYLELLKEQPDLRKPILKLLITKTPGLVVYVAVKCAGKGVGGKLATEIMLVWNVFKASAGSFWDLGEAIAAYIDVAGNTSDTIVRYYNSFRKTIDGNMDMVARGAIKDLSEGTSAFYPYVVKLTNITNDSKNLFLNEINKTLTKSLEFWHPDKAQKLKNIRDALNRLNTEYESYYWDVYNAAKQAGADNKDMKLGKDKYSTSSTFNLKTGESIDLAFFGATGFDKTQDAASISWTSSNTSVATVDKSTGLVKAKSTGKTEITCTVTVKSTNTTYTGKATINVSPKATNTPAPTKKVTKTPTPTVKVTKAPTNTPKLTTTPKPTKKPTNTPTPIADGAWSEWVQELPEGVNKSKYTIETTTKYYVTTTADSPAKKGWILDEKYEKNKVKGEWTTDKLKGSESDAQRVTVEKKEETTTKYLYYVYYLDGGAVADRHIWYTYSDNWYKNHDGDKVVVVVERDKDCGWTTESLASEFGPQVGGTSHASMTCYKPGYKSSSGYQNLLAYPATKTEKVTWYRATTTTYGYKFHKISDIYVEGAEKVTYYRYKKK